MARCSGHLRPLLATGTTGTVPQDGGCCRAAGRSAVRGPHEGPALGASGRNLVMTASGYEATGDGGAAQW